jgi:hypothetical protein
VRLSVVPGAARPWGLIEELRATAPEHFNANEPNIRAYRQRIAEYQARLETARARLAKVIPSARPEDITPKFDAILDQTLLGAPPGGGVAEAVRR